MKKSLFALALCALSAAAAAIPHNLADAVTRASYRAAALAEQAWSIVTGFVLAACAAVGSALVRHLPAPAVALVAARQYLARQVKRQRPLLATRWRMCPSA